MVKHYPDGAELPYRVVYKSKGAAAQEVRFSESALAQQEVQNLLRRGHCVDFDVWAPRSEQYITRERFT